MSDRLHVATRKGLFVFERRAGTGRWEVVRTAFLGDPVSMVLDDPRDRTLYAALNLGHFGVKLRRSEDGGGSWTEVTTPAFPERHAPSSVQQIWTLEAGGADRPGVLWAGTIPGGLFRSEDRGGSWTLNEALWGVPQRREWFGGGYDQPGIHSVCVDPRDGRRLSLAVSCGGVWETRDDGASWTLRGEGMYAEYMPPDRRHDPTIQDPHRMVRCTARPEHLWVQHHNGVFRSTDEGLTWSAVENVRPSKFGFAVAVHPSDPRIAWTVPAVKDECRVPVDGRVVVARTRDGGDTFEILDRGLPREHAYDLVYRHALDVDGAGERLALGSTTGGLWVSEDQGDSFTELSSHLPPVYAVRFAP